MYIFFFFQAEDGIRDKLVTGVQTCALPILMEIDRPVVKPEQLDRVVLWVNQKLEEIKGTYAYDYIHWGSKQTFSSKKSEAVAIPRRATVAARDPWYDLTGLKPGVGFWPKSQQ